jgi:penicillin-binding protein 2
LVTPLQIAAGIVAIANGGTLYSPHFLHGDDAAKYVLNKNFISGDNLEIVRRGMRETIVSGSARFLGDLPIQVAGKTGTAQWNTNEPNHAWFVGFGPYKDPQIVVLVLIEAGGEGSSVAAPVAKKVFDWWARNRFLFSPAATTSTPKL